MTPNEPLSAFLIKNALTFYKFKIYESTMGKLNHKPTFKFSIFAVSILAIPFVFS